MTLTALSVLTLAIAGVAGAMILTASATHRTADLLALAVVLGVPLLGTIVGASRWSPRALLPAVAALLAITGTLAAVAVGEADSAGWSGVCGLAGTTCPDTASTVLLSAMLVGALPTIMYLVAARKLRGQPAQLAVVYLITLPAFVVFAAALAAVADLLTTTSGFPAD